MTTSVQKYMEPFLAFVRAEAVMQAAEDDFECERSSTAVKRAELAGVRYHQARKALIG